MLLLMTLFDSFLWLSNNNSIAYMYHSFFIHSFVGGHRDCFHVLAIVNSVAVNTGVHLSLSIMVSSGYTPSHGISGRPLRFTHLSRYTLAHISLLCNIFVFHSHFESLFPWPLPLWLLISFISHFKEDKCSIFKLVHSFLSPNLVS